MKLKIVIKVSMPCEKDRLKAMRIASTICGVSSVSIGKENDSLEVVGENVDSVCLAKCLRKKFCVAHIISVEEVKPPKPPKTPSPPKCRKPCPLPCPPPCPPPCRPPCRPPCQSCCHPSPCQTSCDTDSDNKCPIM